MKNLASFLKECIAEVIIEPIPQPPRKIKGLRSLVKHCVAEVIVEPNMTAERLHERIKKTLDKRVHIVGNPKNFDMSALIKECTLEVLKERVLGEAFDPTSQGPNIPEENPYPEWNAKMARLEETGFESPLGDEPEPPNEKEKGAEMERKRKEIDAFIRQNPGFNMVDFIQQYMGQSPRPSTPSTPSVPSTPASQDELLTQLIAWIEKRKGTRPAPPTPPEPLREFGPDSPVGEMNYGEVGLALLGLIALYMAVKNVGERWYANKQIRRNAPLTNKFISEFLADVEIKKKVPLEIMNRIVYDAVSNIKSGSIKTVGQLEDFCKRKIKEERIREKRHKDLGLKEAEKKEDAWARYSRGYEKGKADRKAKKSAKKGLESVESTGYYAGYEGKESSTPETVRKTINETEIHHIDWKKWEKEKYGEEGKDWIAEPEPGNTGRMMMVKIKKPSTPLKTKSSLLGLGGDKDNAQGKSSEPQKLSESSPTMKWQCPHCKKKTGILLEVESPADYVAFADCDHCGKEISDPKLDKAIYEVVIQHYKGLK